MKVLRPKGSRRSWRWLLMLPGVVILASGFGAVPGRLLAQTSVAIAPEVVNVTVAPGAVSPGEPVTVSTNVYNSLDQQADFTVVLRVDDVPEEERSVRLPARATRTLRFSVIRAEPGAHVVQVGDQAATFQVLSAQFVVRDLSVEPALVAPGQPVTLRATVRNTGAAPGVYEVPLAIGGTVTDLRTGLLKAGQSTQVVFEARREASGSYAVLVGELPGEFTVASPAFDITVPSSIRISPLTTTAADARGQPLAITGDVIRLRSLPVAVEVTLPAALSPGGQLKSFEDTVSGMAFTGTALVVPLRDPLYREVARLILTELTIAGQGNGLSVSARQARLVVQSTVLQAPPSAARATSLSFGIDVPLAGLKLDAPLRLVPGLRPDQKGLAAIELAARASGLSVAEVVGFAVVEVPASVADGQGGTATVSFGVSPSWLASVAARTLSVAFASPGGNVELSLIAEVGAAGSQDVLKATTRGASGTFVLVRLAQGSSSSIERLVFTPPVAMTGAPVEIVAFAGGQDSAQIGNAVLTINGQPTAVAPVRLLTGGTRAATFYVTLDSPGVYDVDVGGIKGRLTAGTRDVVGHAQVTQLKVEPKTVAPGQPVKVSATLSNVGPRAIVFQVPLTLNGAPAEQAYLAIAPGEVAEARFTIARNRPGTYAVAIMNAREVFTVAVEPSPASFQVSDLRVLPATVGPGESVQASVTVANLGERQGSYTLRVFLNRSEEERKEIVVDGLTTLPLAVSLQPTGEGIFTVEIEGMRRDFVVVSPKRRTDLALESIAVEPTTVSGDAPIVVTVRVRNRVRATSSGVLSLLVNGELVEERKVELGPDGSGVESFSLVRSAPGLYVVEVRQGISFDVATDIMKGEFLVTRRQSLASWEITRLDVKPQPAPAHEPLSLSFLLSNLGQQAGELTIAVEVDGQQEVQQVVRLGPQTTREMSIPLSGRPPGTYTVSVDGVETRFVVSATAATATRVPTPVVPIPGGGASPWVWAALLAGLAAAAGAGYAVLRRQRAARRTLRKE